MDATSFLFVAVIVLLGGPLAYGADWLGRRLGKKRLSIFGLRPRHTATALTVTAGILIPLFTVLAMLALSKGVREWVFEGPRALQDKARLEGESARLVREIGDDSRTLNDLRRLKTQTDKSLKDEQKLFQTERTRALALQGQLKGLNVKLGGQQKLLATRGAEVKKLTAEVSIRAASIAKINAQLSARQKELNTAIKSLADVRGAYKKLDSEYKLLDQNRIKLDQLNIKLDQQNHDLQAQIDRLKPEIERLKAERAEQQRKLDQGNRDLEEAKKQRTEAENNLNELNRQATQLIGASRTEPMIYHRDDELVRLPVDSHLSPEDAREAVENMLSLARAQASSKGAEASEDVNVVGFAPVVGDNPMSAIEVQSALTRGITDLRDPAVMVASTPINVFRTQAVLVQVRVFPNPLVYRQGQTIIDTRIDGMLGTDEIFQKLQSLMSDLTKKAITDQMIPRQGQDTPLGEVNFKQISDVVQAIRAEGRVVKVQAIAKTDTRAADTLQIEFKVVR